MKICSITGRADGAGGAQQQDRRRDPHDRAAHSFDDAMRRGWILTNPARIAHTPKRRPLSATRRVWNASQLGTSSPTTVSTRYHAAIWLTRPIPGWARRNTRPPLGRRGLRRAGYEWAFASWYQSDTNSTTRQISHTRRAINLRPTHYRRPPLLATAASRNPSSTATISTVMSSPPRRRPTHPQLLSDAFQKLVHRSGLPRVRFHDLRHAHATLLLKAGVPIKVVSERLGHSARLPRWRPTDTSLPACNDSIPTFADILATCGNIPTSTQFEVTSRPATKRYQRHVP